MKKPSAILCILLILCCFPSCHLKEKFEQYKAVNESLISAFQHEKINTSYNWSTTEGENNVSVTFYDYPIDSVSYPELEEMANQVQQSVQTSYPGFKELDYIEVRFTKEKDLETADSFVTFKNDLKPER
ncbi:hypothetical protein [Rufibacter roseus]|uniref:DUF4825 domain-containing protein n=1 Tax=Rufibacter roseus TaxID=1567108 RepID=A0ABW2DSE0_9BACT|nr:hypothetical protein [Rufibacter roseus]